MAQYWSDTNGTGSVRAEERPSRLAAWSSACASLSVPVLIITAIGHRGRLLDTPATYGAMALGFSLAGLAVITAMAAFTVIWQDGRRGTGRAMRGLVIGLIVLAFPGFAAWKLMTEPQLTDVTTSFDDPPRFVRVLADHEPGDMPGRLPGEAEAELQRRAHPDIVSRFYPVSPARVFEEASGIVARYGWEVLNARPPGERIDSGRIEAVATTMVFGFRQDVVVRMAPEDEGTLVDMRSAARTGAHDLGANAERIRAFLTDLDRSLQGVDGG